jgi:transcriptional regulator with XRE-family HTH domain
MLNISKIKNVLKSKKISQEELANLINMSKTNINQILKGRTDTKISTLIKIAESLNVPVSYFFDESPAPVENSHNNTNTTISQVTNGNGNSPKVIIQANEIKSLKREIELLQDQLKEKDEIIRLLKELNSKNR